MTLAEKIRLIDDLIRQDPDATILDYLETMEEISNIENANFMSTRLNSPNINAEEKALILRLAAERKSAIDIAAEVGVSVTVVYKTCQRAGKSIREIQYPGSMAERGPVSEEVKKTASRPAAEYSNKSAWGIATEYNNQKAAI